jgi:hypothetical protein
VRRTSGEKARLISRAFTSSIAARLRINTPTLDSDVGAGNVAGVSERKEAATRSTAAFVAKTRQKRDKRNGERVGDAPRPEWRLFPMRIAITPCDTRTI